MTKDWRDGLKRFIIHFGGWLMPFVIWVLLGYVGLGRPAIAIRLVAIVMVAIVLARELDSTKRGTQTKGKMWIDLASKISGILVGATGAWLWE